MYGRPKLMELERIKSPLNTSRDLTIPSGLIFSLVVVIYLNPGLTSPILTQLIPSLLVVMKSSIGRGEPPLCIRVHSPSISLPQSPSNPLKRISGGGGSVLREHLLEHRLFQRHQLVMLALMQPNHPIQRFEICPDFDLFVMVAERQFKYLHIRCEDMLYRVACCDIANLLYRALRLKLKIDEVRVRSLWRSRNYNQRMSSCVVKLFGNNCRVTYVAWLDDNNVTGAQPVVLLFKVKRFVDEDFCVSIYRSVLDVIWLEVEVSIVGVVWGRCSDECVSDIPVDWT